MSDQRKETGESRESEGASAGNQSTIKWILSIVIPCITGLTALSWSVENFLGLGIPTLAYAGAITLSVVIVSVSLYLIRSATNGPD